MADAQVSGQENLPKATEPQQGCGCGKSYNANAAVPATAKRIRDRLHKVYKTRFKVF